MASAAMAASSVSVVASSLVLKRYKKPDRKALERQVDLETSTKVIRVHRGLDEDYFEKISNSTKKPNNNETAINARPEQQPLFNV